MNSLLIWYASSRDVAEHERTITPPPKTSSWWRPRDEDGVFPLRDARGGDDIRDEDRLRDARGAATSELGDDSLKVSTTARRTHRPDSSSRSRRWLIAS